MDGLGSGVGVEVGDGGGEGSGVGVGVGEGVVVGITTGPYTISPVSVTVIFQHAKERKTMNKAADSTHILTDLCFNIKPLPRRNPVKR